MDQISCRQRIFILKLEKAETGQQSPSRKVGNLAADEGKPTAGVQGIVEKWQRTRHARERADGQQVFSSFLMRKATTQCTRRKAGWQGMKARSPPR